MKEKQFILILKFWFLWTYKKIRGLKNFKWGEVKSMTFEQKFEILHIWKAEMVKDKEIF